MFSLSARRHDSGLRTGGLARSFVMGRRVAAAQGTADYLSLLAVEHPLSAFDPVLEAVLE